jgi:hypothetical protein
MLYCLRTNLKVPDNEAHSHKHGKEYNYRKFVKFTIKTMIQTYVLGFWRRPSDKETDCHIYSVKKLHKIAHKQTKRSDENLISDKIGTNQNSVTM